MPEFSVPAIASRRQMLVAVEMARVAASRSACARARARARASCSLPARRGADLAGTPDLAVIAVRTVDESRRVGFMPNRLDLSP